MLIILLQEQLKDLYQSSTKISTNETDNNHFKLLNNAVYGKTMEI